MSGHTGAESRIRAFLHENFGFLGATRELDGDTLLLEQGILDSTGVLEVAMFLETELGVVVDDQELVPENFGTIRRLVAFVARRQGQAAA